jgi:hypothetical protein
LPQWQATTAAGSPAVSTQSEPQEQRALLFIVKPLPLAARGSGSD